VSAGFDLSGRAAIVTGGSRGIGLAIAEALISAGASVLVTSRKPGAAEAAAESLGPDAIGFQAHVTDEDASQRCVAFAVEQFGRVDILVNNAGTNPAFGPLAEMDHSRFAKTVDVNLWGPTLWTGLAWRAWMGEHGGSVINTSSLGGLIARPDLGVYHATKAALINLTKHFALELAPKVRVNAVAPGVVRTRLAEALWRESEDEVAAQFPLGRIGEPRDIAGAVAFLASDAASWITGETIVIDGGQILGAPSNATLADQVR
jgi:NAD(P)-dependent dehydrogenase (short-subunit alcohol dehydrogenase family)